MDWKQIYDSQGIVQVKPSRRVIDLVPLLRQEQVRKVLDHGCGTGRHVKYLFDQGFEVYGTDYSRSAIEICRRLVGVGYAANLVVSDMSLIPFPNNHFDCVISSQVVQHALKPKRDMAVSEIKRTLGTKGIVLIRTISQEQFGFGCGDQIEDNTYVNIPGIPDGSTPHHYFSQKELEDYFRDFDIISLTHERNPPTNQFWDNGLNEWILLARRVR